MATPSEITAEDPLPPPRISLTLNRGGGADIKWNGPLLVGYSATLVWSRTHSLELFVHVE